MVMLGILAGAFIGLGAMFYILILSDANLSFGISETPFRKWFFHWVLILVIVAGAELFTGNNLLVMACADGKFV